jgi:hypothetical protein
MHLDLILILSINCRLLRKNDSFQIYGFIIFFDGYNMEFVVPLASGKISLLIVYRMLLQRKEPQE